MIDSEKLTSVLNSLATIDQDRFNKLTNVKSLWESGIMNEAKMQSALDESIAFVNEFYFPNESEGMELAGVSITINDLDGYNVTSEGNCYRIEGKQTVLVAKDIDINIFNQIKLEL